MAYLVPQVVAFDLQPVSAVFVVLSAAVVADDSRSAQFDAVTVIFKRVQAGYYIYQVSAFTNLA